MSLLHIKVKKDKKMRGISFSLFHLFQISGLVLADEDRPGVLSIYISIGWLEVMFSLITYNTWKKDPHN